MTIRRIPQAFTELSAGSHERWAQLKEVRPQAWLAIVLHGNPDLQHFAPEFSNHGREDCQEPGRSRENPEPALKPLIDIRKFGQGVLVLKVYQFETPGEDTPSLLQHRSRRPRTSKMTSNRSPSYLMLRVIAG